MTQVAVFGLGYVGCVTAACLADLGHTVVGVDVNPDKVAMIDSGRAPIIEEEIDEVVSANVASGRLRATTDSSAAVAGSELALICVGTPTQPNGAPFVGYLERVVKEIGRELAGAPNPYTVVVRSTIFPGTCEQVVVPLLEQSSRRQVGEELGVAVNPEFLREGTSVRDFHDPARTVVGAADEAAARRVASLYAGLPGEVFLVPMRVAEMVKYVDNGFHALKVAFANEIGVLSKAYGLDSNAVMDLFCADTKLNISTAYLRPGYAFGGSCLPKDLRALLHHARRADLDLPVLSHVLPSNEEHVKRAYDVILGHGRRRVGLLGLSFKAGTDDLRESPVVDLAERLLGRGFDLRIHDRLVSISNLTGANRAYIQERIPHLSRLMMSSAAAVVEHSEICVVATHDPAVLAALEAAEERIVVDLAGIDARATRQHRYEGIAW
ncbi:MAG: GDP-mannose dehydrogenase [Candidatus Rokuibacteriota bacterium]|nr:MAG: GDP-mannose dehydrogenase [Candidatus Rokubacteria bacterium]